VRTGVFLAAAEPATTSRPAEKVQTGGFGSPEGLASVAQGGNLGNLPKLGTFGLPEGPGVGNGTGGLGGLPGVVATAGFERVGAGPGAASGADVPGVRIGGFEKAQLAAPAAARIQAPPPPDIDPIEILFKPLPIYTDEARRLQIQGEVVLSVVFQASGSVRIIRVLEFLGHGLDQAAEQAALQIRFKPARRGGQPIDFPATVRIQFRLADQST
jgi:TonB family protein